MVKDASFLLALEVACEKSNVFTDATFHQRIQQDQDRGRFPPGVRLLYAQLPEQLDAAVLALRRMASVEGIGW